jgi:TonB-linked SusC/RagA family outer membrane protein
MKRKLSLFLLLTCWAAPLWAQIQVSGRVTAAAGNETLPGVSVVVEGTNTGAITGADGRYTVQAPANGTLKFSYIGYQAQSVPVNNRTAIDVALATDQRQLGEVVVTALGIERETKALQYSVTEISGEPMQIARENNVANQLAGRVAGVNVTNVASGPAGSSRVIIRGNTSLQGNNQPLYVIDGIPMDNSNFGQAGMWGGADRGDGTSSINPDDIESITVLKGASAAALYGARAGNGVINIVTKRGSARKGVGVEYNTNYTFEQINDQRDLQRTFGSGRVQGADRQTAVPLRPMNPQDAWAWGGDAWGPRLDGQPVTHFDGGVRPYVNAGDNFDRFYQTGTAWTNTIGLSGGGENQTFRATLTDLRSQSVVPNSGFDRFNASLATNGKFGKRLTFDAKVLYSHENAKNRPRLSDSPNNAFQQIFRLPADVNVEWGKGDPNRIGAIPPFDHPYWDQRPAGSFDPAQMFKERENLTPGEEFFMSSHRWSTNPYWATHQIRTSDTRDRIISSGALRYNITDWLYVSGRAGMDWFTRRDHDLTPQGTGHNRKGNITEGENRVREINLEAMLGVNREFGAFGLNAFVGANRMRRSDERIAAFGQGFNVPFFEVINNAAIRNFNYGFSQWGINSVFGSAEISYNNYLFLTGTVRTDWFSVLNPDLNNITYPSIGASFVFTDAIAGMPNWLSFGKVRSSWAQVGISNIGPYNTQLNYQLLSNPAVRFDGTQAPMAGIRGATGQAGQIPNFSLLPATSTEIEFGTDLRFLQNRIGLDLTYYHQRTTNDQLGAQISRASGFNNTLVNVGEMENRGIEVLLTGTPVVGAFTWDVSVNFARNRNRVISLIPGTEILNVEEPRTRTVFVQHRTGYPFGVLAGWVQARDPQGRLVYEADGTPVQSKQMEVIGNGVPDFTGGINNSFSYRGFNMSFLIDVRMGGDVYSGTNVRLTQWGHHKQTLQGREGEAPLTVSGVTQPLIDDKPAVDPQGNPIYEPFERTLTPGEAANYWNQLGNRAQENFIYDGSFAKLRQFSFGYTFPNALLARTPFQNVNLSFVGRNLSILWKNIENVDPESGYSAGNAQGLDYFGFPQTRSYGFNLRMAF